MGEGVRSVVGAVSVHAHKDDRDGAVWSIDRCVLV